jgi:hypothetical protein
MNCKQVRNTILSTETPAAPAAPLRQHLDACPSCTRWHERLLRLERDIAGLPLPSDPGAARERFLHRFLHAPGSNGTHPRLRTLVSLPRPGWYVLRYAAAAAVLLGLALASWFWLRTEPSSSQPIDLTPLMVRVLEHDLCIAEGGTPEVRRLALANLAADLQSELDALGERSAPELPLLTRLHEHLSRSTEHREGADVSLPARTGPMTTQVLLEMLVVQGPRLAHQDDPLHRADYCNEMAEFLALAIRQATESGDTEWASQLGSELGKVMDRGVAGNLVQVVFTEDDPREDEIDEVSARAQQAALKAINDLKKTLEKAPRKASRSWNMRWSRPAAVRNELCRQLAASRRALPNPMDLLRDMTGNHSRGTTSPNRPRVRRSHHPNHSRVTACCMRGCSCLQDREIDGYRARRGSWGGRFCANAVQIDHTPPARVRARVGPAETGSTYDRA